MDRRINITKYLDWPTFFLFLGLVIMGWVNIYSASYDPQHPNIFDPGHEYGKQFIWIVTAIVLGSVILLIEGEFFMNVANLIYLGVILLLVAVLFFGKEVNGARSWFGIGSFGIQPSEFAKPAVSLALARFLGSTHIKFRDLKAKVITGLIILAPAGLIMLQPDTGTALIFASFLFVLYREGLSGNILFIGFLAAALAILTLLMRETTMGIPFTEWEVGGQYVLMVVLSLLFLLGVFIARKFAVPRYRKRTTITILLIMVGSMIYIKGIDHSFNRILNDHQQTRVKILLGLMEDPQGAGYNVKQSKTAIGSGGFSGKGFLEGTLTKYKYVPMQSTDFIFCTIGEEWGFLGSFFIIVVFVILLTRIIIIAERQRAPFTRVYGYCVASILFFHLLINIGMAIGLAPVIGIPLPFFSYGGSSLWAFTILLFILLRLDAERMMVLR